MADFGIRKPEARVRRECGLERRFALGRAAVCACDECKMLVGSGNVVAITQSVGECTLEHYLASFVLAVFIEPHAVDECALGRLLVQASDAD